VLGGEERIAFEGILMTYASCLAALVSAAGLIATTQGRDATRSDHELIQGRWEYVSVRFDGRSFPLEKGDHIVISGRNWTIHRNKLIIKARHTLDPTEDPKHLDLVVERDGKTFELKEIYRIEGDELILCEPATPSAPRPTAFSAEQGEGQYLIVLKRGKRDEE
jgi:uncharacterized protein (TIGR03067 family)